MVDFLHVVITRNANTCKNYSMMRTNIKIGLLLTLFLIIITPVNAISGNMKLLAVSETNSGYIGNTADLTLTIKPGDGKVFIDSFPLTKLDTQISTRFAKEVACNFLNVDCSHYDFFYVISSKSSLIGGPSAGSALTILVTSLLQHKTLNQSVGITGTINSGGFIGPVSGIKQKIEAAAKKNISLVLIPIGSSLKDLNTNKTFTIPELENLTHVKIIEVSHISEAIPYFIGKQDVKKQEVEKLQISPVYTNIMKYLSELLCNRTQKWKNKIQNLKNFNQTFPKESRVLLNKSKKAYDSGYYYASASYCFGSNVALSKEYFSKTVKKDKVISIANELTNQIYKYKSTLPTYNTLNDLEAYTAVSERLNEALEDIKDAKTAFEKNETKSAIDYLAYANERYYSAYSWSKFFHAGNSSKIKINTEKLNEVCLSKISEAQERVDYLKIYIPTKLLQSINDDLSKAYVFHQSNKPVMCIYKASKVKAKADVILNSIGLRNDSIKTVFDKRMQFILENIIHESSKGHFPILSYSYYEYAKNLRNTDINSAMLYAEYALELGSFNMYFPNPKRRITIPDVDNKALIYLIIGISVGLVLGNFLSTMRMKTRLGTRGTKSGKKR